MKRLLLVLVFFTFHFSPFAQNWLWGRYGIGDGIAQGIAGDNKGNCYLSGLMPNDTIHFGGYTFINPPYSNYFDAFLVKYNAKGNLIWAKQWFNKDTSLHHATFSPTTTTVGNNDNVYLNGNFSDTLIVGAYTMVTNDGFQSTCIAKYDSNGNLKWARTSRNTVHSDTTGSSGKYISCDNYGNVFLLGVGSYDTVYFGAYKLFYYHNIYFNDFLVKYDSNGNVKWAKQAVPHNSNSNSVSSGMTNDQYGNTYTTGGFGDTVQYGSYTLSDTIGTDFDIIKWDSSGNVLWVKQGKPVNTQPSGGTGISITIDKYGNVYACGDFFGSFLIGQDTIKQPPNYQNNFFVVKYSPNGNVIWVKQATILDGTVWQAWSITCDSNNNIYLTGDGGSGTDTCKFAFGGDTLILKQTNPTLACFLLKLDTNGKALCGVIMQKGTPEGTSITSDASGRHVYFASSFSTEAVFGQDTINPNSYPINHIQGYNYFPVVARWQACDSNIFEAVPEKQKPLSNVSVYPNPNNGNFIIALQNINEPAQVEIYNVLGEKVKSEKLNKNAIQIEMSGQASGVYFYRVITQTGSLVGEGKIVKE